MSLPCLVLWHTTCLSVSANSDFRFHFVVWLLFSNFKTMGQAPSLGPNSSLDLCLSLPSPENAAFCPWPTFGVIWHPRGVFNLTVSCTVQVKVFGGLGHYDQLPYCGLDTPFGTAPPKWLQNHGEGGRQPEGIHILSLSEEEPRLLLMYHHHRKGKGKSRGCPGSRSYLTFYSPKHCSS